MSVFMLVLFNSEVNVYDTVITTTELRICGNSLQLEHFIKIFKFYVNNFN